MEAARQLPVRSANLDGEIVVDGNGQRPDFLALQSRAASGHVEIEAATWLDETIVVAKRKAIYAKGFGAEVSKAITSREAWLIANGHASAGQPGTITPNPGMIETLHQRSLKRVVEHVSAELNLRHLILFDGSRFQGRYVKTVQLP